MFKLHLLSSSYVLLLTYIFIRHIDFIQSILIYIYQHIYHFHSLLLSVFLHFIINFARGFCSLFKEPAYLNILYIFYHYFLQLSPFCILLIYYINIYPFFYLFDLSITRRGAFKLLTKVMNLSFFPVILLIFITKPEAHRNLDMLYIPGRLNF